MNSFDVCIIGTGIAGLTTAIKLSEKNPNIKIACFSKEKKKETNTRLAQGGIAAVIDENDSFEFHIQDTLKSGKNTNNLEVVKMVVSNAPECIKTLVSWGVNFNKEKNGKLSLGLEGGHSRNRIVHVNDYTGKAIQEVLIEKAKKFTNIVFFTNHNVFELVKKHNKIVGFYSFDSTNNKTLAFKTKYLVLATGGIGQFFDKSTNSIYATGDGIILANDVSAKIENLQSIQFHPTALYEKNRKKLFLISEAVRGFGAYIVNDKLERFLFNYDKRGELATRDIISNAIYQEMQKSSQKFVYIDLRHLKNFSDEFPMIFKELTSKGYSIDKDLIPIIPAAHYQCGGVKVNINAQTNIENLFAVGECSETGLHGKNRLASNSLLEAFVYANKCSQYISEKIFNKDISNDDFKEKAFIIDKEINPFHFKVQKLHKEFLNKFGIELIKNSFLEKVSKLLTEINKKELKTTFSPSIHNDKKILELIILLSTN